MINLGKRKDWLFEKILKIEGMTTIMQQEYGIKYTRIISTKTGNLFVNEQEHKKIMKKIQDHPKEYRKAMRVIAKDIEKKKNIEHNIARYFFYFFIGKVLAEQEYNQGKTKGEK